MPIPNPLQSRSTVGDLSQYTARDIERELKRVSSRATMQSGQADYPYLRKRRAALLKAAQRYRSLTSREQQELVGADRYDMEESDLSKQLDQVLFD